MEEVLKFTHFSPLADQFAGVLLWIWHDIFLTEGSVHRCLILTWQLHTKGQSPCFV